MYFEQRTDEAARRSDGIGDYCASYFWTAPKGPADPSQPAQVPQKVASTRSLGKGGVARYASSGCSR